MGGRARARKLSAQRRSQIATLAANVRWGNVTRRQAKVRARGRR